MHKYDNWKEIWMQEHSCIFICDLGREVLKIDGRLEEPLSKEEAMVYLQMGNTGPKPSSLRTYQEWKPFLESESGVRIQKQTDWLRLVEAGKEHALLSKEEAWCFFMKGNVLLPA